MNKYNLYLVAKVFGKTLIINTNLTSNCFIIFLAVLTTS